MVNIHTLQPRSTNFRNSNFPFPTTGLELSLWMAWLWLKIWIAWCKIARIYRKIYDFVFFSFLSSTLICILHLQINFQTKKFGEKIRKPWFGAKWGFATAFFVNWAKTKRNIERTQIFVIKNTRGKMELI